MIYHQTLRAELTSKNHKTLTTLLAPGRLLQLFVRLLCQPVTSGL
jgi:hypothetical protein